nr:glycosyltransferase family 4 protein [Armatimonas rosea]
MYVSTLDHIVYVMLPQLDGARAAGYETHVACQFTRFKDDAAQHADFLHPLSVQRNPLDPRNIWALVQLVRLIKKIQPDIIHCHNPSGGLLGRLAATLAVPPAPKKGGARKPVRVYTAHGFHFHPLGGRLTNVLYRAIERFAGRFLSDAVLTINQWDFEEAQRLMPKDRVFATHGVGVSVEVFDPAGVPAETRQALRAEFGVPDGGLLITCIGELLPRKNQKEALAVLDQVRKRNQERAPVLVLVGDGREWEALQAQLAGGDKANVHLAGFRRDTKAILAASDIFLFPSLQEGLPCAVQEALCMEVPVVCYPIRGCVDLVDSGCGRIAKEQTVQALTAALEEVLALTPDERKALGRAGREKMRQIYSREHCIAEWLEIYKTLGVAP